MESELDPLQVVRNNSCNSPERTCYYINRSDNATITHHSIQKQRTTAKEPSMHGFIQVPVQAVFTTLVCLYQEQTSVRTNVIGAYTRILLPGILGNSKRVTCWPMALEVYASPYISIQMRVFLFPL